MRTEVIYARWLSNLLGPVRPEKIAREATIGYLDSRRKISACGSRGHLLWPAHVKILNEASVTQLLIALHDATLLVRFIRTHNFYFVNFSTEVNSVPRIYLEATFVSLYFSIFAKLI